MGKIAVATVALILASGSAVASDKADVLVLAHKWADTFNSGGFKSGAPPCADDAVVLDDFPPHVWQGSDACLKWYEAFKAYADGAAITDAKITFGTVRHLDISTSYGYLVATVTLTFKKAGKSVKDDGVITMTLHNPGSAWRITGLAWADQ